MRYLVFLLIVLVGVPALAQDDCTTAKPCQAVPWQMPSLPLLASPTPGAVNPNSIFGAVPSLPDSNGSVGDTSYFNASSLNTRVGLLRGMMNRSDSFQPVDGALIDVAVLGNQAGLLFGYVLAFSTANFGVWTPAIALIIIRFWTEITFGVTTKLIPALVAVLGFIRKVITLVLDFLPL